MAVIRRDSEERRACVDGDLEVFKGELEFWLERLHLRGWTVEVGWGLLEHGDGTFVEFDINKTLWELRVSFGGLVEERRLPEVLRLLAASLCLDLLFVEHGFELGDKSLGIRLAKAMIGLSGDLGELAGDGGETETETEAEPEPEPRSRPGKPKK